MKPFEYSLPKTLFEFFEIDQSPGTMIVAGGTDVLPKIHNGSLSPVKIIDISAIEELDYLAEDEVNIHIGSLTTFTQLFDNRSIQKHAPSLINSIKLIGAPMTRSRGTIGGNIANASPAGDTLTPLMVLDAWLTVAKQTQKRTIPLRTFFKGPGQTVLENGEIIQSVSFQKPVGRWGTSFKKIGPRRGMTISIVNVAVFMALNDSGFIEKVQVACGSVAPFPMLCSEIENFIIGKTPSQEIWKQTASEAIKEINPIDDVRGTKEYRLKLTKSLIQNALSEAYEAALERNGK